MKASSDTRPEVIQRLGDTGYYFNYNVVQIEEGFSYDAIQVWHPTREEIVKAIIREYIDQTQELNLINKFNLYNLGLSTDITHKMEYEKFLQEIARIKELVRTTLTPEEDNKQC